METFLHHRFKAGAEGECRFSGSGSAAKGDNADLFIEQEIQGDPLFGASSMKAKSASISAD
jgi:hypothetical protein